MKFGVKELNQEVYPEQAMMWHQPDQEAALLGPRNVNTPRLEIFPLFRRGVLHTVLKHISAIEVDWYAMPQERGQVAHILQEVVQFH